MALGLGVKAPEKECEDKNCPFHGQLPVRGRTFEGVVTSKNGKTVTVKWQYHHHVPKYERYMRRNTKVMTHCPPCMDIEEGDEVKIGETRPISKGKSFVVIEKLGE
ncbi:MAG: 30S ribosomal protein S17 [Candidatus Aenigmatarchaeota archaeon]